MKKALELILVFSIFFSCLSCNKSSRISDSEDNHIEIQEKKIFSISKDGVYASNLQDGFRMNEFSKIAEDHYQAIISPENTPINSSAWFAFQIWSDSKKELTLTLKYLHHKHRYIPKISRDGKNWNPINTQNTTLNQDSTSVTFPVSIHSDTLWIAAQEVFSSKDIYTWMDDQTLSLDSFKKEIAGKSVLGKNIYAYSFEPDSIKPSILIVARQHPPEVPGGTIAFKAFFQEIISSSSLAQAFREQFNIYTFPVLNPDGVDMGHWRHNANGVDLNRDWKEFKQAETQVVRDFIFQKQSNRQISISFGIDFHTSYTGPYLLILDSLNEQSLSTRIIPRWRQLIGEETEFLMEYKRRDQELPYFYNWMFNEFQAEGVTYEEGDEFDRDIIKNRAILYAQKWMESMLTEFSEHLSNPGE